MDSQASQIDLNTTQALLVKLIRDEVPGRGDLGGGDAVLMDSHAFQLFS